MCCSGQKARCLADNEDKLGDVQMTGSLGESDSGSDNNNDRDSDGDNKYTC